MTKREAGGRRRGHALRVKYAVWSIVLALSLAYVSRAQAFIVGGSSVAASDPVAKVTAALESRLGWICTGTIVASDILITAAHCVDGAPSTLLVTFARDVRSARAVRRQVISYRTADAWNNGNVSGADQGDIAVVRFRGGLPAGYQAATLLPATGKLAQLAKDQAVTLAGYGVTGMSPQTGSGLLRKVTVKIAGFLGRTEVVLDQRQGKGACHGDSGGPAFVSSGGKLYAWGVTNRGYPDFAPDDCKQMSVYTNINAYRPWITQVIAELRK